MRMNSGLRQNKKGVTDRIEATTNFVRALRHKSNRPRHTTMDPSEAKKHKTQNTTHKNKRAGSPFKCRMLHNIPPREIQDVVARAPKRMNLGFAPIAERPNDPRRQIARPLPRKES